MGRYVCGEQWTGAILSGGVATGVILKTGVWQIYKEKSLFRHSRAGGNLGLDLSEMFKVNRYFKLLDSRLSGNDDMNVFNFNLL